MNYNIEFQLENMNTKFMIQKILWYTKDIKMNFEAKIIIIMSRINLYAHLHFVNATSDSNDFHAMIDELLCNGSADSAADTGHESNFVHPALHGSLEWGKLDWVNVQ